MLALQARGQSIRAEVIYNNQEALGMEMQDVLTTVNGSPVTVKDVTVHLKTNGIFRNAIYQLIENRVIASQCQALHISIDDRELHEHAETKRRLLGLSSAMEMNRYCKWHGILMEQWNEMVHQEILRKKLKEKVITESDITAFFAGHKQGFGMAHLSRIVCAGREEAQQAKDQVLTQGKEFSALARQVSIERNTRIAGGYIGCLKAGTLPRVIDQAVFFGQPGDILGPFDQSGYWVIYKIEEIKNPELDEALKANIADHLFSKWLQKTVLSTKV
jgi:hypothetical protein